MNGMNPALRRLLGNVWMACCLSYVAQVGSAFAKNDEVLHSVAVTLAEDGGPYYEQFTRGAEHAAKAINPAVKFTAVSCKNDAAVQMEQLDKFAADGTQLVVIQSSYAGDSSPAVQRARKDGMVVVALDAEVPGGTDVIVRPDEIQGGRLAAEYVAGRLPEGGESL